MLCCVVVWCGVVWCGVVWCAVCGGWWVMVWWVVGGSDKMLMRCVCPNHITKHLIMGAVSLWTRPLALYLCTEP